MNIVKINKKLKDYNDIILCKECEGYGWHWSALEFGDIPGDERKIKCSACKGTGRIKIVVVEAEIEVPCDWEL